MAATSILIMTLRGPIAVVSVGWQARPQPGLLKITYEGGQAENDFCIGRSTGGSAVRPEHECEAHCEPGGCSESRDAYDLANAYLGSDQ